MHSLEEICRQVLQQACDDGIVTFNRDAYCSTESPLHLTSGDICGMANLLGKMLRENRQEREAAALYLTVKSAVLP